MQSLEKAISLKEQLDRLRPISSEDEIRIMQKFRLDWNFHSNHIEGNSLTFGETKALILFGITAQGKPLKDHFEISGHNEAIDWIMDVIKQERPLTENFIRQIHEVLLKEPYEVDAETPDGQPTKRRIEVGKYKTIPNHVKTSTGEIFRFATPEETPAEMQSLLTWYNEKKESEDLDPIIFATEFHYKLIRIHPFDDGNGRIARLLMNLILLSHGYPPAIIKTEDKENYFSVLRLADSGKIEPFVNYIADNILWSLDIMIKGAKGESVEEPDDIDMEIGLIEQQLLSVSQKIEVKRHKEVLTELFEGTITKLIRKCFFAFSKFNKFYFENHFYLQVNRAAVNAKSEQELEAFLTQCPGYIEDNMTNVLIQHNFQSFNQMGFGEFSHTSQVSLVFNLTNYLLTAAGVNIEKYYTDELTDEDIYKAVDACKKQHVNLIKSAMEKQKKKE